MFTAVEFALHGLLAVVAGCITIPATFLLQCITGKRLLPTLDESVDLRGQVCIVTGSNTGIGKKIASNLCQHGATVIIACRSRSRAVRAMDDILSELQEHSKRGSPFANEGKVDIIELDLSSLSSIKSFADQFYAKYSNLDVLVNNGGINTAGIGPDRMQQLFTVNYLGHFYLFCLMQPALATPSSVSTSNRCGRVVNLSSVTHHTGRATFEASCFNLHGKDMEGQGMLQRLWEATVDRPSYYSDSKLYLNLLTMEINRRYCFSQNSTSGSTFSRSRPISAVSVNPGAVRSDIWRSVPRVLAGPYDLFMRAFYLSVEQGAAPALFAATLSHDAFLAHCSESRLEGTDAGGRFVRTALVPYVVPYRTQPLRLLAWEMISPFAGPQWADPSLPSDPEQVARGLWTFSHAIVDKAQHAARDQR